MIRQRGFGMPAARLALALACVLAWTPRAPGEGNAALVARSIESLQSKNARRRLTAARRLGQLQAVEAVDALAACLKDKDRQVAVAASHALGSIGDPRAVGPMLEAMSAPGAPEAALLVDLGRLGDRRAAGKLMTYLKKQDAPAAPAAATGLGALGDPRAVDALLGATRSESAPLRSAAAEALGQIDDPRVTPALIALLERSDPPTRVRAAGALVNCWDRRAVAALKSATGSAHLPLARAAIRALDRLAMPGAQEAMLVAAKDPREEVRGTMLACALGKDFGPGNDVRRGVRLRALALPKLAAMPLEQAIDYVRRTGKVNVYVNWGSLARAGVRRSTKAPLRPGTVRAIDALDTILSAADPAKRVTCVLNDDILVVLSQKDLQSWARWGLGRRGTPPRLLGAKKRLQAEQLERKLNRRLGDIRFDGVSFPDFLEYLQGMESIHVGGRKAAWDIPGGPSAKVTIRLAGAPIRSVLECALYEAGGFCKAWYAVEGEKVSLKEQRDGRKIAAVRIYGARVRRKTVEINGRADRGVKRIEWNWGDGTGGDGPFPARHRYAKPGSYRVRVTATTASGKKIAKVVPVAPK